MDESNPANSLMIEDDVILDQQKIRLEIVYLLCMDKPIQATNKAKTYFQRVLGVYDQDRTFNIYNLITDGILLVKSYLQSDEPELGRQILLQLVSRIKNHTQTHEFTSESSFRPDEGKTARASISYQHLKKKTSVYSTLAALFCASGDYLNGEKMYVQYVKLIEVHLGSSSLDASNCYFMMGVFYYKQRQFIKSIACFKRALTLRSDNLGEDHETVGD